MNSSPKQNIEWKANTACGELELSINVMKPEKDPALIAAARDLAASDACDLCWDELEVMPGRFEGTSNMIIPCELGQVGGVVVPALRAFGVDKTFGVEGSAQSALHFDAHKSRYYFALDDAFWRVHYSPYQYYSQQCIAAPLQHAPMHITRTTFERLVHFVELFSYYFMGSNADLPIVGGSILAHDHFQGGGHVFPLMKAPLKRSFALFAYPTVQAGVVEWPSAVIRLQSSDASALVDAAAHVLQTWQAYSDDDARIACINADTQVLQSTVTPIAYRAAFVEDSASQRALGDYAADGRFVNVGEAPVGEVPATEAPVGEAPATEIPVNVGEAGIGVAMACNSEEAVRGSQRALDTSDLYRASCGTDVQSDPFVLDLVLRNNATARKQPWGIFHVDEPYRHIKKENIGLIEIMGKAILPGRLAREIPAVEEKLLAALPTDVTALDFQWQLVDDRLTAVHAQWAADLLTRLREMPQPPASLEELHVLMEGELGNIFANILTCTNVFRYAPDREAAWQRFIDSL